MRRIIILALLALTISGYVIYRNEKYDNQFIPTDVMNDHNHPYWQIKQPPEVTALLNSTNN